MLYSDSFNKANNQQKSQKDKISQLSIKKPQINSKITAKMHQGFPFG